MMMVRINTNVMRLFWFLCVFTISTSQLLAQQDDYIDGYIIGADSEGNELPLLGANVYWLDTQVGTTADENGYFKIKRPEGKDYLVASFIGYSPDTIRVRDSGQMQIILSGTETLEDVEIVYRQKSTEIKRQSRSDSTRKAAGFRHARRVRG